MSSQSVLMTTPLLLPWLWESSANASEWLRYQQDQWRIEKSVLLGENT